MTTTFEGVIVEPGVYDLANAQYHKDPVPGGSLSATGARALVPPSCPAMFRWERDHGRPDKTVFDFGHAAHKYVLDDDGTKLEVIHALDYGTKAARRQRDLARLDDRIPILDHQLETVEKMVDALRAHPIAGGLFAAGTGLPEQSLFWRDERTGIWRRRRLDWLPNPRDDGRMILVDYKSTKSAEKESFAKSVVDYGYHMAAAWSIDAVIDLGLAEDAAFLFVAQEKTPPFLVNVVELDARAQRIGRYLNGQALDTYARCVEADEWPGYSGGIELIGLPFWYENRFSDEVL